MKYYKIDTVAGGGSMRTFRFIRFSQATRDSETSNTVACRAETAPSADWAPCDDSILFGLTQLEIRHQSGRTVEYWGYL